ncbi:MAG: EAL domain-containing protein [Actinomycetota bacterium]|nr:EAL domain-containing protein [Actinomycetota bacterium]
MRIGPENWSTQQLVEFLALVSSFGDEASATRGAVERAAEALEAEVAALVRGHEIVAAIGFPAGDLPEDRLLELLSGGHEHAELPGLGRCSVAVVHLEGSDDHLLVARAGEDVFTFEEADLLRGMGRVLGLTQRLLGVLDDERRLRARADAQARENARLLSSLQERQRLLERLSAIQRKIVVRAASHEVLEAIVAGTAELIGADVAALRLIDPQDESSTVIVAATGLDDELIEAIRRGRVGEGAGGRAIAEDRLVVIEDYAADQPELAQAMEGRIQAAMAAPVREHGKVVGSLVVASTLAGCRYGDAEHGAVLAFAEHASLALSDAKTVDDALHQAFHDGLTDLPNRAMFVGRLEQALAQAADSETSVAVLFLDLDRFKNVNDSLGHAAGDELLIAAARRLRGCVRPADMASRFGGDEFALLLEDLASPAAAERVALRVLTSLEAPFTVAGREVFISASIGIATGAGPDDDPVRDADLAMYRAKAEGKARFVRFETGMHVAVVERLELEADLQRAVDRDELLLHYQPVVDLHDGEVIGLEALLRWQHPVRGTVPPGEFIGLAEEAQLMPQLGRWVLDEACRQMAAWRRDGARASVAVNVSGNQLQSGSLPGDVAGALERSGLPPEALALEITETVLMSDVASTVETLGELKALGVRLAVDDFGTGYSSLQYLRGFPIDILKIDKTFVDDLGGDSDDVALARAIIDLGHSFGLSVVAEGIEREDQRVRLLELGCGLGQGFLFARPVTSDEVPALLAARGTASASPGPRR